MCESNSRCYGVARQREGSRQNSIGCPALTSFISLMRVGALMARPWSARCYGVARQREGSRQNSIGGSGVLSLRHFGLAGWFSLSLGAWGPNKLARRSKQNKAIADQSPLLKLSLPRVRFQRTSTRQQLDCAKTL